jgi:hypothetical protein
MKGAIVYKGPIAEIVDSLIPDLGLDDVVTKIVVGGLVLKTSRTCILSHLTSVDSPVGQENVIVQHEGA